VADRIPDDERLGRACFLVRQAAVPEPVNELFQDAVKAEAEA
jgi:hypothetical protein